MSTKKEFKINQLLQSPPSGVVYLSSRLVEQGYSHDLL
ncbi:AbiEi antitoxin N-terminal domain-containing protein [Salegentibacter sp. 24]